MTGIGYAIVLIGPLLAVCLAILLPRREPPGGVRPRPYVPANAVRAPAALADDADDLGIPPGVEEEIARDQRALDRQNWRRALWALLTTRNGNDIEDAPCWRRWRLKTCCLAAMLLGRRFGDQHNEARDRHGKRLASPRLDIAFWDYHHDGYGWSAFQLIYHPRLLRYSIDWDGESFL